MPADVQKGAIADFLKHVSESEVDDVDGKIKECVDVVKARVAKKKAEGPDPWGEVFREKQSEKQAAAAARAKPARPPAANARTLVVSRLPADCSEDLLKNAFGVHGVIEQVWLLAPTNTG